MSTIDLRKKMVIDLKKKKGIEGQIAEVHLAMDYSGSMSFLYSNGTVQKVVERILPIGLGFDDNGEIDFHRFHHACEQLKPNVTLSNYIGYVDKYVRKGNMGTTKYAPIIRSVFNDLDIALEAAPKKGLLSSLFGSKKQTTSTPRKVPVYVVVITDGENEDTLDTEQALIAASHHGVFFQFVGIGHERFNFLRKLDNLSGRLIDNANFFPVTDIERMSDEELYDKLLGEFPDWLKLAKENNLIA